MNCLACYEAELTTFHRDNSASDIHDQSNSQNAKAYIGGLANEQPTTEESHATLKQVPDTKPAC
jgi:hypothetical protein